MKTLSPQCRTVLEYLRTHTHITPWQAEGVFRIRRLASRIDELRAAGYAIQKSTQEDASGQRYTRYSLTKEQRRAKRPLLTPRQAPAQFRIDKVLNAYRDYCRTELDLYDGDLDTEVAAFRTFLENHAA